MPVPGTDHLSTPSPEGVGANSRLKEVHSRIQPTEAGF